MDEFHQSRNPRDASLPAYGRAAQRKSPSESAVSNQRHTLARLNPHRLSMQLSDRVRPSVACTAICKDLSKILLRRAQPGRASDPFPGRTPYLVRHEHASAAIAAHAVLAPGWAATVAPEAFHPNAGSRGAVRPPRSGTPVGLIARSASRNPGPPDGRCAWLARGRCLPWSAFSLTTPAAGSVYN